MLGKGTQQLTRKSAPTRQEHSRRSESEVLHVFTVKRGLIAAMNLGDAIDKTVRLPHSHIDPERLRAARYGWNLHGLEEGVACRRATRVMLAPCWAPD